jgi:hypothetical protein
MSENILQLAKQAGLSSQSETTIHSNQVKFAELVIQDFVSRLKSDTNEWVNTLGISDQNEINKIYEAQLARQLDEEWYWAIK